MSNIKRTILSKEVRDLLASGKLAYETGSMKKRNYSESKALCNELLDTHDDIDLKPMMISVRESADEYAIDIIERYTSYGLSCGLVLAVYNMYQKMLESQRVGF